MNDEEMFLALFCGAMAVVAAGVLILKRRIKSDRQKLEVKWAARAAELEDEMDVAIYDERKEQWRGEVARRVQPMAPVKSSAAVRKPVTQSPSRAFSSARRDDDDMDMLNPLNPLSPLSPLSPLNPIYQDSGSSYSSGSCSPSSSYDSGSSSSSSSSDSGSSSSGGGCD
jgi:uncharacterized membrane protein YgcG